MDKAVDYILGVKPKSYEQEPDLTTTGELK